MIGLSCATISCDGFGDNDFIKSFEMMPKAGFRYIEFNCWYPSTLTTYKMDDLRERCENHSVLPSSIHGSGFGGETSSDITRDVTHKLWMMEAAKRLGCNRISATGAARGTQGGIEEIIKVLKEIIPAAEENNILISLENHKGNNLEFIEDYKGIFDSVNSPSLGICLDTGHFDASCVDINELINIFKLKINHIHLKENLGYGSADFKRFSEGTTDNFGVIEKMLGLGYEGFLVCELSPQNDRELLLEDIIKPRTMFKKYEKS